MVRRPHTSSHVTFCSSGFMTNVRYYICTSAISMTTKLDRVVTCVGRTPASRPCDLCDHVITWQTKKIISEFPQYILPPNLAECKLMVRRPYKLSYMTFWSHCHVTDIKPYNYTSAVLTTTKLGRVVTFGGGLNLQSHMNFWLRGHVRNEKDLYLHLPNTYDHQTWQSGNLYWGNPTRPRGKWETLYSTYLRVVLILLLSDLHAFLVNVYLGCKCLFVICFYILNIFLKTFIYSSD